MPLNIIYAAPNPEVTDSHTKILSNIGNFTPVIAEGLTETEAAEKFRGVNILILTSSAVKRITRKLLSALPDLKYISTTTSGCDWVDLQAARELGISVSNCAGGNAQSVAEHTLGMIIDLSKRITEADRAVRLESAYNFSDFRGREVRGKTLGILGLGHVGTKLAQLAQALSMPVLAFDLINKSQPGVKNVDFNTLLSESDIISILLPLTDSTKGLIGSEQIARMRDGVIIVNTSREAIMDKSAIISGLSSGKIYGLGVDAAILTQIPSDDPYFNYPNVIITPHNAFCTMEADSNVQDMWVTNIQSFVLGNPRNIVN